MCVRSTTAGHQTRLLRMRERSVWRVWERLGCQQRVSGVFLLFSPPSWDWLSLGHDHADYPILLIRDSMRQVVTSVRKRSWPFGDSTSPRTPMVPHPTLSSSTLRLLFTVSIPHSTSAQIQSEPRIEAGDQAGNNYRVTRTSSIYPISRYVYQR